MSAQQFYTLRVADIRRETSDCVSVSFAVPENLHEEFQFKPGQYITIKAHLGEEIRRSYSICSAPKDGELRVAIKKVEDGKFSTYANDQLKVGDQLELMKPAGNFTPNHTQPKNYYGFASGSGITPIMSIMKTVLASDEESTFTLIYGNKNIHSIIFREEIEGLKNIYLDRFRVIHILSREYTEVPLNHGRINHEKCAQLFDRLLDVKKIDEAYICGPEEMIHAVRDYLIEQGVDSKQIKFELFGTNLQKKDEQKPKTEPTGPISKVSIKVDERTFDIDLAYDGDNILDAALANGADLPYACKGGVCCTCRAKVLEGEVEMLVNYALEEDEVAQGFILTCQAHPKSDRVVVDFDVR